MGTIETLLVIIFGFIAYIIINRPTANKPTANKQPEQSDFDREVVERVIAILKERQGEFKANWSKPGVIEQAVSLNFNILIFKDGCILRPARPEMTEPQKAEIRELIKPIFRRAEIEILDNLK